MDLKPPGSFERDHPSTLTVDFTFFCKHEVSYTALKFKNLAMMNRFTRAAYQTEMEYYEYSISG